MHSQMPSIFTAHGYIYQSFANICIPKQDIYKQVANLFKKNDMLCDKYFPLAFQFITYFPECRKIASYEVRWCEYIIVAAQNARSQPIFIRIKRKYQKVGYSEHWKKWLAFTYVIVSNVIKITFDNYQVQSARQVSHQPTHLSAFPGTKSWNVRE